MASRVSACIDCAELSSPSYGARYVTHRSEPQTDIVELVASFAKRVPGSHVMGRLRAKTIQTRGIQMLRKSMRAVLLLAAVGCGDIAGPRVMTQPGFKSQLATTSFQAVISGPMTKPAGCAVGITSCGSAEIGGFGKGQFSFTITAFAPTPPSCASYEADVVFSLSDGSTLTLAEEGTVCGPGKSFFPQPAPGGSYGNPVSGEGSWTIVGATGQFAGLTGTGTSRFDQAGASLHGRYLGN